jgi:hypothetical protein
MKQVNHGTRVKVDLGKSYGHNYGTAHSVAGYAWECGEDPKTAVALETEIAKKKGQEPELFYAIQESAVISAHPKSFDHSGIELLDGEEVLFDGILVQVKVNGDFSDMIVFKPAKESPAFSEKKLDQVHVGLTFSEADETKFMEEVRKYVTDPVHLIRLKETQCDCEPECILEEVSDAGLSVEQIIALVEKLVGKGKCIRITDTNTYSHNLGVVWLNGKGDIIYFKGIVNLFPEDQYRAIRRATAMFGDNAVDSVNMIFGITLIWECP